MIFDLEVLLNLLFVACRLFLDFSFDQHRIHIYIMSFSTGDFLAICRLIADIDPLLRDSRHDYQQISDQLQVLQTVLAQVAELDPPKEQEIPAAILKNTAMKAKTSLLDFRDRMKRYERSLGRGNSAGKLKDVERKLSWGLSGQAATAEKLQRELNSYVGSINMALGSTTSTMRH